MEIKEFDETVKIYGEIKDTKIYSETKSNQS